MIFPESVSAENENEAKEQTAGIYGKNVIAIGRQFGSGGHDIGKVLAEKLGYDFYDAEIIQMTAGTTGYTPEFVKKNEEIMTNKRSFFIFCNSSPTCRGRRIFIRLYILLRLLP